MSLGARFRKAADRHAVAGICVLLLAGIAAVYWPVSGYGFLYCDDPDYVSGNAQVQGGLSWAGLRWALTSWEAANWHPLTWLSHMLDVQLFGMNPGWHHLTNLVLHAANSLLLFFLLMRMTGAVWRSGVVAGLFALHPLHVESVAWVAERKDVLSGFFFMLTLLAYARFCRELPVSGCAQVKPQTPGSAEASAISRHWRIWYVLALLLFAFGLMSKPMLVTLPFVLLLLDFWPLQRLKAENRSEWFGTVLRLFREKLPFFALSAGSAVVTFLAQQRAGSVTSASALPLGLRIENALVSYALYLKMLVWPVPLAAYYPHPRDFSVELVLLAGFALLAITLLAFWLGRTRGYLMVGWLWYLGTLIPVIGLVQVGMQAMADRYMYLPVIGLLVLIVWSCSEVIVSCRWHPSILSCVSFVSLVSCLVLAAHQVVFWRDSETLYRHALAVTRDNALAHQNLGAALAEQGKLEEASAHFAEALKVWPDYPEAQSNLGFVEFVRGNTDGAIARYRAALQAKPKLGKTHFMLGMALASGGLRADAINEYQLALELEPNHEIALNNLAWMLATDPDPNIRDGPGAVNLAERLCRLSQFREAQYVGTLAAAYAESGRFTDAVAAAERAESLARAAGNTALADKNRQLLEFYRAARPYHEPAAVPVSGSGKNAAEEP